MITSQRDKCVGCRVDVARLTPVRAVVAWTDRVDTQPRIHHARVLVDVPRHRVPAADDRCAGAAVVPADRVRVSGESTDKVRRVPDVGLNAATQRRCRRRDCSATAASLTSYRARNYAAS